MNSQKNRSDAPGSKGSKTVSEGALLLVVAVPLLNLVLWYKAAALVITTLRRHPREKRLWLLLGGAVVCAGLGVTALVATADELGGLVGTLLLSLGCVCFLGLLVACRIVELQRA